MTFPASLDALIDYVTARRPVGSHLGYVTDASEVAERLGEQSDALLGHFVDQARRSGASWTQIGAAMGVSKQAAHKQFVLRWVGDDPADLYAHLTRRCRRCLAVARALAETNGADSVSPEHIVASLLTEPDGYAARILHQLGVTDENVLTALKVPAPATPTYSQPDDGFDNLQLSDAATAHLRRALDAAVRLGHTFIGTEHVLIGALTDDAPTAPALHPLGISVDAVETRLARLQLRQPK